MRNLNQLLAGAACLEIIPTRRRRRFRQEYSTKPAEILQALQGDLFQVGQDFWSAVRRKQAELAQPPERVNGK